MKADSKAAYDEETGLLKRHARLDPSHLPEDTGNFRQKRNLIAHHYDAAYESDVDDWIENDLPNAQNEIDAYWVEEPTEDWNIVYIEEEEDTDETSK